MQNKKNNTLVQLKNWLLNKPLLFAFSFFILSSLLCLGYALIQMAFNIETTKHVVGLFALSFVLCIWYVIKKLPHEKMNQNNFIAITNGATLISLFASFIAMITVGLYGQNLSADLMIFYFAHKTLFIILVLLLGLFSLYLIGLGICNIYAKYKRATSIGISPWKVILSMPFAFLLMWTPGYLLKGKDIKDNLQIKCPLYMRFQKWVIANPSNILFMFLILLLCRGIIAGLATFILCISLFVIYILWYTKHKSDFIKNINKGYTTTAIGINIAILVAVIIAQL